MSSQRRWSCCLLLATACAIGCTHAEKNPQDRYTELDALIARAPGHVGALHHAARTAADAGDGDRAVAYLRALVATGFDDALEPADFVQLADREDYRDIAHQLDKNAPVLGSATLLVETDCLDVLPEGTAYDPTRGNLLISSGHRRSVIAVAGDGRCSELVPSGDGGLLAVLGMDVDSAHDALWVVSAAAPFMRDAASARPGDTLLSRIDLANGRVVASHAPPTPGMLNDLDLLDDGRIAVTDSIAGTVYLFDPAAPSPALVPLLPPASFDGPNGIVALSGNRLLVTDFHALWLLEPDGTGRMRKRRLAAPEGRYMGGMDGMARDGDHIVAIQNLVGLGRVWRFRVDFGGARIADLQLLLRQHPDLRNPTTGVVVDRRFLFVADPNLQTYSNDKVLPAPQGRRGHRILALPLPRTGN